MCKAKQIETHGAVKPSGCKCLEKRFQAWGRKVHLTQIAPNDIGRGGVLRWKCIFEGDDAQRGFNFERHYNNGEMANDGSTV